MARRHRPVLGHLPPAVPRCGQEAPLCRHGTVRNNGAGCRLLTVSAFQGRVVANWCPHQMPASFPRFAGEQALAVPALGGDDAGGVRGRRREAENMAHCGVEGTMYGKVQACNFLCHPYAKNLLMLTVEVRCAPSSDLPCGCQTPHGSTRQYFLCKRSSAVSFAKHRGLGAQMQQSLVAAVPLSDEKVCDGDPTWCRELKTLIIRCACSIGC